MKTRYSRDLDRAMRRLALTTGDLRPIARRNARKNALAVLRDVRKFIDAEYPAIVSRKGVKRLTGDGQAARLIRAGWKRADRLAGYYAAEGIPVKKIRVCKYGSDTLWIPGWAAVIGPDRPSLLREAKKSRRMRNAILARDALLAS